MGKTLAILNLRNIKHIRNGDNTPDYLIIRKDQKEQHDKLEMLDNGIYDTLILHCKYPSEKLYIFKNANFSIADTIILDDPREHLEIDEDSLNIDVDVDATAECCCHSCDNDDCEAGDCDPEVDYDTNTTVDSDDYMFNMNGLDSTNFSLVRAEVEILNSYYNPIHALKIKYSTYKTSSGPNVLKNTFINNELDSKFEKDKSYQKLLDLFMGLENENIETFYNSSNLSKEHIYYKEIDEND
jgi:hypothetical protein